MTRHRRPGAYPVGELDLIVGVLSAKFPGHTSADVRDVVYETIADFPQRLVYKRIASR